METCYKCGSIMASHECDQCHRVYCSDCWGHKTDLICPDCLKKNELKLRYSITHRDYDDLYSLKKELMELFSYLERLSDKCGKDARDNALISISEAINTLDQLLYRFRR